MLVFVLNKRGDPLMPCKPAKAKHLLRDGKAKVVRRTPFVIQLLYGSSGYRQPVQAGMDSGSKTIGSAAISNDKVIYQSEVSVRQDVSKAMKQRASFRHTRRGRKCRYRSARFDNRRNSIKEGRLPPSVRSKVDSHLREKRFAESILPVSQWTVETASFDIHKITNHAVEGVSYQQGPLKDYYNVKAYVLHRDNYQCQSGQKVKHHKKLHVHHVKHRKDGGSNAPSNLLTLCKDCHDTLHRDEFELTIKKSKTKHATQVSIIKSQLLNANWDFKETFGYETKHQREQILDLPKTHYHDAIAIACDDGQKVQPLTQVIYKRHVPKGDYQQRKGSRSEKVIPTGKLFNLKKFDFIQTSKGNGFVKGKRSSGYFALMDIFNQVITASVNIKKECIRLTARTTTLTEVVAIPPLS